MYSDIIIDTVDPDDHLPSLIPLIQPHQATQAIADRMRLSGKCWESYASTGPAPWSIWDMAIWKAKNKNIIVILMGYYVIGSYLVVFELDITDIYIILGY